MSQGNFQASIAVTLDYEGSNDDDPHDPGGRTSRGIEQREWNIYRESHPGLASDVWKAPQSDILNIYQAQYWVPVSGDVWPKGVDLTVFDAGVNSGIGKALTWSRYALNQSTGTLAELAAMCPPSQAVAIIKRFAAKRLSFLHGLKTWAYFGKGWGSRVSGIEAISTKWALQASGAPNLAVQAHLSAEVTASAQKKAAAGGTATASSAAPAAAGWNLPHETLVDWLLIGGVCLIATVLLVYCLHVWYVHSSRAVAFSKVSQ